MANAFFFSVFSILFISGITYAAINWPSAVPNGEVAGGKFAAYFANMLGDSNRCATNTVVAGFDEQGNPVCVEQANGGGGDGSSSPYCAYKGKSGTASANMYPIAGGGFGTFYATVEVTESGEQTIRLHGANLFCGTCESSTLYSTNSASCSFSASVAQYYGSDVFYSPCSGSAVATFNPTTGILSVG